MEVNDAMAQVGARLDVATRKVAEGLADGLSVKEIASTLECSTSVVKTALRKLERLRQLLPDEARPFTRGRATTADADEAAGVNAPIDHEIERMLRRPVHEKADCPVCWKCCYFYGLTPKHYHPPTGIADHEVRMAVERTEGRKIQIGGGENVDVRVL